MYSDCVQNEGIDASLMLIKITGRVISASAAWVSLITELIDILTLEEIGVSVFLFLSESSKALLLGCSEYVQLITWGAKEWCALTYRPLFFPLISLSQPREKGRMRFHRLQNVQIALDYLKRRQVSPNSLILTNRVCHWDRNSWSHYDADGYSHYPGADGKLNYSPAGMIKGGAQNL